MFMEPENGVPTTADASLLQDLTGLMQALPPAPGTPMTTWETGSGLHGGVLTPVRAIVWPSLYGTSVI